MSNDIKKKGFLERIPAFSLILIMAVLMVVGGALIPLLRISYHPSPEQGKRLTISFSWPGASQRVIEQEITSKVEGLVASVVGVEKTSSVSSQGNGSVTVVLKEKANVSAVRFEISETDCRELTGGCGWSLFTRREYRGRASTEHTTGLILYHQCRYGSR
mgnify:CR=1 FL=1